METTYRLQPSKRLGKKYDMIMIAPDKKKTVSFGAAGMSDYTKHHDDLRKASYINRHKKREMTRYANTKGNLMTPAYLALNVLWNKKTIGESIADIEKKQGIKINR